MGYIENNLRKDEKVVLEAKISLWALLPTAIWMIIAVVAGILIKVKLADWVTPEGSTLTESSAEQISTATTVCMLIFLVIGILPFVFKLIDLLLTKLAITNRRIMGRTGVLSKSTLDIPIDKIDTVTAAGSFFGRIFHYEYISVRSVGGSSSSTESKKGRYAVANANEFRNCANDAIEQHAEEARKAQAAEIAAAMGNKR